MHRNLWAYCSWNAFGMLYYFAGFNGYLLLGHYLRNHDWSGRQLVFIGMPMFVAGYAVTFLGFRHMTSLSDFTDEMLELYFTYCSLNVVMMTVPVFVLCKRANIKSERVRRALANLTFCGFWCVYDTLFLYRTECGTDARYPYSHSFADTLCGSGGILCILVSGSDGLSLFREEDEMGVGIGVLNYLSAFSTVRTFSALSVRHCCTSCIHYGVHSLSRRYRTSSRRLGRRRKGTADECRNAPKVRDKDNRPAGMESSGSLFCLRY